MSDYVPPKYEPKKTAIRLEADVQAFIEASRSESLRSTSAEINYCLRELMRRRCAELTDRFNADA